MTLGRQETSDGLIAELEDFEELLRSLSDAEWEAPSRCAGWRAADVAAHVVGQFADVVAGRFDGLGTPEVTARQVADRAGRTPAELADELVEARAGGEALLAVFDDESWDGPAPASVGGTLGAGVESLWFDAWLHADDIRNAAGRATVPGPAVRASLSHIAAILTDQGWGPATLKLDGYESFTVGSGEGDVVTGDAIAFVLAATGRGDPSAFGLDETVNIYR